MYFKRAQLVECAHTAHTLWHAEFRVLLKPHVVRKIQTHFYTGLGTSHLQIIMCLYFLLYLFANLKIIY